jgi:hypothetical protein
LQLLQIDSNANSIIGFGVLIISFGQHYIIIQLLYENE